MNFTDFIIFFASALSVLMAIGLFLRPLQFRNVVLASLLLLLGYIHLFIYLVYSEKLFDYPHLFLTQIPAEILIGPLLYFYVLNLTGDRQNLKKSDFFHFVPVVILVLAISKYYFYSAEEKKILIHSVFILRENFYLRSVMAVSEIIPVFYMMLGIRELGYQIRRENPSEQKIIFFFMILLLALFPGIIGIAGTIALSFPMLKIINLFISFIILCFYLISQRYQYLLQFGSVPSRKKVQARSYLDRVDISKLESQLKIIMGQEKLFCDERLTLPRLSEALGVTTHQLSEYLNEYHRKNFNNFVNGFRIDEAKKILLNDINKNIHDVAYSVGFNSYSAFHSSFKKDTGHSPADYRQKVSVKK